MNALPLADGLDDAGIWVYVVLVALGVLGGLFKKKQGQPGKPTGKSPKPRPPQAPPRVPTPPRPPRVPQPPRPPAAPREAIRARPIARAPGQPAPYEPPVRRPVGRRVERRLEPEPVEVWQEELADQQLPGARRRAAGPETTEGRPLTEYAGPSPTVAEVKGTIGPAQPSRVELDRLERLLRDRPGLRAAVILSEILAPPVALRENHPL